MRGSIATSDRLDSSNIFALAGDRSKTRRETLGFSCGKNIGWKTRRTHEADSTVTSPEEGKAAGACKVEYRAAW